MSAGKINEEWLSMVRTNAEGSGRTVEDLIKLATNARDVGIDAEGSVWIADPQRGHWLAQFEIDALCVLIGRGV